MNASEFKTKCLAELDRVDRTGEPVVILKHGRPVARLVRDTSESKSPANMFKGMVEIAGDIVSPTGAAEDWNALSTPRGPGARGKSSPG